MPGELGLRLSLLAGKLLLSILEFIFGRLGTIKVDGGFEFKLTSLSPKLSQFEVIVLESRIELLGPISSMPLAVLGLLKILLHLFELGF